MSEQPTPPRLGLTTAGQAAAALLGGAVLGYFVVGTIQWRGGVVPITPWSLPLMLAALGIGAFVYARVLRGQLAERPDRVSPEAGLRALVLGKTLVMSGAVMAGAHLVYVLGQLGHLDASSPRLRAVHGAVTIVGSVLFALGGHAVERSCMVPPGDDREGDGEVTGPAQQA